MIASFHREKGRALALKMCSGWMRERKFVCLSVINKGRRAGERGKVPNGVLLTTMCAGDGDLASLSACLL